jgi:hypothetical protein
MRNSLNAPSVEVPDYFVGLFFGASRFQPRLIRCVADGLHGREFECEMSF